MKIRIRGASSVSASNQPLYVIDGFPIGTGGGGSDMRSYGANSYTWNKPTGSTITSGQSTLSATITFGPNSGNVTVKAVNGCGISGASSKAITINCREGESLKGEFEIYPNPSPGDFILQGDFKGQEFTFLVFDMTGKAMESGKVNEPIHFGGTLPAGVYIVKLRGEGFEKIYRIIKI